VHGVDRLHRKALEQAVLDHGLGAGKTLLAGLEDQHGRPVELPGFGQVARCPDQHRGVTVVTTAMHHARAR